PATLPPITLDVRLHIVGCVHGPSRVTDVEHRPEFLGVVGEKALLVRSRVEKSHFDVNADLAKLSGDGLNDRTVGVLTGELCAESIGIPGLRKQVCRLFWIVLVRLNARVEAEVLRWDDGRYLPCSPAQHGLDQLRNIDCVVQRLSYFLLGQRPPG